MATPFLENMLPPRPVHPTPMNNHGLLGQTFVRHHMMIDDRWSPNSLIEEFSGMTQLLSKRLIFKNLEGSALQKQLKKLSRRLRMQCRDGRTKLHQVLYGDNVGAIRNFLINKKDMQRLYQKMSIHLVVDNINQRTFVMRKERDRLSCRLNRLKIEYENKLLERATIENRIKYQNEFVLDEEVKFKEFMKRIENSQVRLKAIRTINSTYQKIIQVLRHNEIFYEPILRSLCKDIDDQANFIKHILYLGLPAIAKFNQLSEEYRQIDDKSRKSVQAKLAVITSYKRTSIRRFSGPIRQPKEQNVVDFSKYYTRETKSMQHLRNKLDEIETVIKQIKVATLVSKSTEIFPRIKTQLENNIKLTKRNEVGTIHSEFLIFKNKVAAEQESVLLHNYFEDEEQRLQSIMKLEKAIKAEDKEEEELLNHIKQRSSTFVILRYSLWNLYDILRYVDKPSRMTATFYPNSYLKLPLLKFEMMVMRACPPDVFEENTKNILNIVEKKLNTLMKAFKFLKNADDITMTQARMAENWSEYHRRFLESKHVDDTVDGVDDKGEREEDMFQDAKIAQYVPSRKQIKTQSAKLVEELSKKDDM